MPFGPAAYTINRMTAMSTLDGGTPEPKLRAGRTLTSDGQGATGQETRDDGIVRVLFLPVAFHGAIKR